MKNLPRPWNRPWNRPGNAPRFLAALVLAVFCTAAYASETTPGAQLGQRLPEEALHLELVDLEDQRMVLADLLAKGGALIVFTSNTCPYALDWIDRFPRLAADSRKHGISFLLINSNARRRTSDDSPEAMRALAEEHGFDFPYLIDEESQLADALGATRTPEVFLYDGALQLVYHGALDDHSGPFERVTKHWATEALQQLAAGVEITTPNTTALGCAVQRPRRRKPQ